MRIPLFAAKILSRIFPKASFDIGRSWATPETDNRLPVPEQEHPKSIPSTVPVYHLRADQGDFVMVEMTRQDTPNSVRYRLLCVKTRTVITVDRTLFETLFQKEK